MQKIVPHLWFDTPEAREAAEFYRGVFPDSEISSIVTLTDTPSEDCDVVSFRLCGFEFMAISAGPLFRINPSISFSVNFEGAEPKAAEQLDWTWSELAEGGAELMPLGEYPFSKRYGWIQDRFGVSWQVVPAEMGEMMSSGTREQVDRVTQAFLPMKKLDLEQLRRPYRGD